MLDIVKNIDTSYLIIGFAGALLLSFLFIIVLLVKVSHLKKKYRSFLSGNDGKSLEDVIFQRFDKMEEIINEQASIRQNLEESNRKYAKAFSKMKVYKYNAFREMGGETSFVIGLLDEHNNGTLINGMSSQNATYVYAKEVVEGKAKVALSKEELITLEDCMNQ